MANKYKIGDIVYIGLVTRKEPIAYKITKIDCKRCFAKAIDVEPDFCLKETSFAESDPLVHKTFKGAQKALNKRKITNILIHLEKISSLKNDLAYEEKLLINIIKNTISEEAAEREEIKQCLKSKELSSEQKESITKLLDETILAEEKKKNQT